jgi:hypothetical protein
MPRLIEPSARIPDDDWGWTSYKRVGWVSSAFPDQQERRLYQAHFSTVGDVNGWQQVTILFWAKRPILALRAIMEGEAEPITYHDTVVN